MKKKPIMVIVVVMLFVLSGLPLSEANQEFKGKIAKRYEDSKEWWPEQVKPPEGAPNIIIFRLRKNISSGQDMRNAERIKYCISTIRSPTPNSGPVSRAPTR